MSQQDSSSDYSECSTDEDEIYLNNDDEDPLIVKASTPGLNHIRNRSDPSHLRFSSLLVRNNFELTIPELPSQPPKDAIKISIPLQHAITLELGLHYICLKCGNARNNLGNPKKNIANMGDFYFRLTLIFVVWS